MGQAESLVPHGDARCGWKARCVGSCCPAPGGLPAPTLAPGSGIKSKQSAERHREVTGRFKLLSVLRLPVAFPITKGIVVESAALAQRAALCALPLLSTTNRPKVFNWKASQEVNFQQITPAGLSPTDRVAFCTI